MAYYIQGIPFQASPEPQDINGITYVPLRDVVQGLGGTINWDNETKTAQATVGQWTATVQMANETVQVNGQSITLDAPPFVTNEGDFLVPLSFFNKIYGYQVASSGTDVHLSV